MKFKKKSFAKIKPILDMPYLLDIQKKSFERFIAKDTTKRGSDGLSSVFNEIFPIENADATLKLEFRGYELREPKITPEEAKEKDLTYAAPLYARFALSGIKADGSIREKLEQEVYLGEFPLMTETASFIINGDERVVVSQIHRSPGVVFEEDEEQKISIYGNPLYVARIIPYRGAWVELEFDQSNVLYVKLERRKKVLATTFLRAIGYETNKEMLSLLGDTKELKLEQEPDEVFIGRFLAADVIDKSTGEVLFDVSSIISQGEHIDTLEIKKEDLEKWRARKIKSVVIYRNPTILLTLKRDPTRDRKSALNYIYRVMKSQEYIVPSHVENYLDDLIFGERPRRYDLTRVGRYKINRKLKGVFEELKSTHSDFRIPQETRHTLTKEDVVATIKYLLNLSDQIPGFETDDIDHLGNRRVRPVGELLENQVRIGLLQMARIVREQLNSKNTSKLTPRSIINAAPFVNTIKKFFGTGQLSQFLEQTNPLSELTNKRRLSALGPGGLNRKRAGFEVRDVHHTHYGRICPIETPEGENIGLIVSLANYARVNEYGLIETPYRKVENGKVTQTIEYLTADVEDEFYVAQANAPTKDGKLCGPQVITRKADDFPVVEPSRVDYMDVSPSQVVSASAALIPFLEHDDANRALMGSNMQRQAVPLLLTEPPVVATGIDEKIARDSGSLVLAKNPGEVVWVDADQILVYNDDKKIDRYFLKKYKRTNQDTCINQIPLVNVGDRVKEGQVLADGMATSNGQLALGKNLLVAFMSWDGYNFEDAVVVSERLVREDVFTSIHIQEFTCEARETKGSPEEITRDIPGASSEDLQQLDENGIIRVGAEVEKGDILVGKTIPKGEQQMGPEERLIKVLFGQKSETTQDASLRLPVGAEGKVIATRVLVRREKIDEKTRDRELELLKKNFEEKKNFYRDAIKEYKSKVKGVTAEKKIDAIYKEFIEHLDKEYKKAKESLKKGDDLGVYVNKVVKVYVAIKRRLQVGDKLAGRHGNKGVISKIVPLEDMPRMPDGTPVDVIFSPLSIPSRMNVGQLLESMLGWAGMMSGTQMITPVFAGATEQEIREEIKNVRASLIKKGIPEKSLPDENMRITLYDGRTGEPFLEKVTIGYMYIMKLIHLVEDKVHARSTGPYSLVTRQPLGGKARQGGQRLGEMEVWALEAYGAAYSLQEFLTIKSDDEEGRVNMFNSIIKGLPPIKPGTPESFKVLVAEMRALGLNVELLNNKKQEVRSKK